MSIHMKQTKRSLHVTFGRTDIIRYEVHHGKPLKSLNKLPRAPKVSRDDPINNGESRRDRGGNVNSQRGRVGSSLCVDGEVLPNAFDVPRGSVNVHRNCDDLDRNDRARGVRCNARRSGADARSEHNGLRIIEKTRIFADTAKRSIRKTKGKVHRLRRTR
jgi:hypothetical protein